MIIDTLKQAAQDAGATAIIYDRESYQNILVDHKPGDQTICLIDELNTIEQTLGNNGINEFLPFVVKFARQVEHGQFADDNREIMQELLTCARRYLLQLAASNQFGPIMRARTTKYNEDMTDANLIGWRMDINVSLLGYAECI